MSIFSIGEFLSTFAESAMLFLLFETFLTRRREVYTMGFACCCDRCGIFIFAVQPLFPLDAWKISLAYSCLACSLHFYIRAPFR